MLQVDNVVLGEIKNNIYKTFNVVMDVFVYEREVFLEFVRRTTDGGVRIVFVVHSCFTGRACLLQHAHRFQYVAAAEGEVIPR